MITNKKCCCPSMAPLTCVQDASDMYISNLEDLKVDLRSWWI
jgi:hypothetical protein